VQEWPQAVNLGDVLARPRQVSTVDGDPGRGGHRKPARQIAVELGRLDDRDTPGGVACGLFRGARVDRQERGAGALGIAEERVRDAGAELGDRPPPAFRAELLG
jgi:hypothetical protein